MTFQSTIVPEKKEEIIDNAIEHMANGKSLLSFCEANELTYSMVYRWIEARERQDNSTGALGKVIGTHYLAEECLKISDDLTIDPQHKRFMLETRMRLIGKWNKRDYGDTPLIDQSQHLTVDLSGLSEQALQEIVAHPQLKALLGPK